MSLRGVMDMNGLLPLAGLRLTVWMANDHITPAIHAVTRARTHMHTLAHPRPPLHTPHCSYALMESHFVYRQLPGFARRLSDMRVTEFFGSVTAANLVSQARVYMCEGVSVSLSLSICVCVCERERVGVCVSETSVTKGFGSVTATNPVCMFMCYLSLSLCVCVCVCV